MAFGLVIKIDGDGVVFAQGAILRWYPQSTAFSVGRQVSGAESLNSCEKWKSRTHV